MSAQLAELRRLLDREAGLLVRRLRGFTDARYAAAAPPFPSRAAAARHLAQTLAIAGQGLESAAMTEEPAWRTLPELPSLALADAVAVTANDLVTALEGAIPPELPEIADPTPAAWTPDGRRPAGEVAAAALGEVLLHRRDIDGSAPGSEATAAVLAVTDPGAAPSTRSLLGSAQLRCPAYRPWQGG